MLLCWRRIAQYQQIRSIPTTGGRRSTPDGNESRKHVSPLSSSRVSRADSVAAIDNDPSRRTPESDRRFETTPFNSCSHTASQRADPS